MNNNYFCKFAATAVFALILLASASSAFAQTQTPTVLTNAQLTRIVPSGFYFEGQSAPTQPRNSAAAKFGDKQHFVAAIVDTSGYSSEVRAKYEGFLIVDAPVEIGGENLLIGAYGFGFTDDNKFNVFDVGGNPVLSVAADTDKKLRRPRPLMLMNQSDGLRFYSGRSFVSVKSR